MLFGFESKEDMLSQFEVGDASTVDDTHVLFASYAYEDYNGYAIVLFRSLSDGELYCVEGSHCSCNGLEGQWEPSKITLPALHKMYEGGWPRISATERAEFLRVLDTLHSSGGSDALKATAVALEAEVAELQAQVDKLKSEKYTKRVAELRNLKSLLERELKDLQ